jgi:hypothetical protein
MFVNKKLINGAKYSLNKIDLDLDELIYIVDIISIFLEEFKNMNNDIEEDESDDDENENEILNNNYCNISNMQNMQNVQNVQNVQNIPSIAKVMNKYKINIDSLENILKIHFHDWLKMI